jgi:DNA-directed RNA polymerase subunit RPC12/RpoP
MAQIKVKCSRCGKEFYMQDYERKTCPGCGTVAVGPKAK